MTPVTIFWHRRDLRLHDNAGLLHALQSDSPTLPVFCFDRYILDPLEDRRDRRVEFIHDAVLAMQKQLTAAGSSLLVYYGTPAEMFDHLLANYQITVVHTNADYEPYATQRDAEITAQLAARGVPFRTHKDHVVFERDEIMSGSRTPYTVFTPYSRKWLAELTTPHLENRPSEAHLDRLLPTAPLPIPSLADMGFAGTGQPFPSGAAREEIIRQYHQQRNYPALAGTSRLSVHLRFGTVSIREMARKAREWNETWLNELIWRDFYQQIMYHFPRVQRESFRRQYDQIAWRNDEGEFARWCAGTTGYPLVDAGMRELNATGYMHNRVRMVTASFLTKHLLIDWRLGDAYFGKKLLDYDMAANNGGWQWACGSGTDAAPYFRIFNPAAQATKFDPEGTYIKQWVPEINTLNYPAPLVEHAAARDRCLRVFKAAVGTPAA